VHEGCIRVGEDWSDARRSVTAQHQSGFRSRAHLCRNALVFYALQHHKAKRSTNREFYVVRFLPVRLAIVTLKYLVCIRRLAALLRREQLGQPYPMTSSLQKHLLFQNRGKAWEPTRVTATLKATSKRV
jgi:hypothetical protein